MPIVFSHPVAGFSYEAPIHHSTNIPDFGIDLARHSKMRFAANGFYDGIGIDDYDSYGGSLKLTVPLN